MKIVSCPHCRSTLFFAGTRKGGPVPCPNCRNEVQVPEKDMSEEVARKALEEAMKAHHKD